MTKKSDRRLQTAMSAALGTRARMVEKIPGLLGTFVDGEKTIRVPGREDFVFVRLRMDTSEVIEAFNDQVGDLFGTPVTVIRDESAPRFYRVISRDIDTYQDWGSPYLVNHAQQHMFSGGTGTTGSDVVWVYRRAFVPLGVSPNGSMTTNVASDYYIWDSTVKHFGPTGTADFTNIRDSLGIFEARFVTVFLNGDANELNYITGEIFDNTVVVDDPTEFISVPDTDEGFPLAAVYIYNAMSSVLWKDIFDIRQIIQGTGGGAGGSGVNWANVIIVATSGGDHTTITAALAAASSGDTVLVMPGTYAEAITLVAGVTVVGLANSTGPVIIVPVAGSPVTIPSGAGTYRLHNCTLTPPSGTTCVDDNMGASGIAELYRVSIGSVGGGDSIDSSGGNASALLTIEECRLAGNFTQFTPCDLIDSISTSTILPAASAGDLTIYGGEVGGNITHVSGQTVAYLNTPFIGGAVSGSATEFGSYTDGVNDYEVTGDVVIQSGGGLYIPDLFDSGSNIPFVSASSGLFSSSTQLIWTGAAVSVTNEGASSPRGFHSIQYRDTGSVGAQWTASRARGTLATPTAVQADDSLGEFRFRGFDTLFTDTVAEIQASASENFITGSHGSYLSFFTTPDGSEVLTEAARITNDGDFVVGSTASPQSAVQGRGIWVIRTTAAEFGLFAYAAGLATTFRFSVQGGSPGSESATTSGQSGQFVLQGFDGSVFTGRHAAVVFSATENWSGTNRGAKTQIIGTPDGSTTAAVVSTYQEGIQVGTPTGGDKGAGTINVATDIYKNNTAYTNPDHVLEHWATGSIVKHQSKQSEDYEGLLSLDELKDYIYRNHRLPRINNEPVGVFGRGDIALEKIEELFLYLFQLHERIQALE